MNNAIGIQLLQKANDNLIRTGDEVAAMQKLAAHHYGQFLKAVGFDYEADPNSADTPNRVAKAWLTDLIKGTHTPPPKITQFPAESYDGIVFQGNIKLISMCSHHNLSFTGVAHVAYIAKAGGKVIGLSKLNRIVDWFARRPQIQEGLTEQIHDYINSVVDNDGVAVQITANHTCCSHRGIGHSSTMQTAKLSGYFKTNEIGTKDEFYKMIDNLKK
jgi:GTP cyclohydrolase IA